MADLAKTETASGARRRSTANQDFTLPSRRQTDAPGIEVNAPIVGAGGKNSADVLARTLGLVSDAATALGEDAYKRSEDKKSGQGAVDAETGTQNADLFKNSRAYRSAFQLETAKSGAFKLDSSLALAISDRLANEDDPATLDDIDGLIEDAFKGFAVDPATGKARDFGSPQASLAVAQQLAATRARLRPLAVSAIKDRTDEKTLSTIGGNVLSELEQGPVAKVPGAPGLITLIDPNEGIGKPAAAVTAPAWVKPIGGLPVSGGRLTSGFGPRVAPMEGASKNHLAVDLAVPVGTPVKSTASGRVLEVGTSKDLGKFVRIDNGDGVVTTYAHLSAQDVAKGDFVPAGKIVAKSGSTGVSTGPHLHWRVEVNGKPVDPRTFKYADTLPGDIAGGTPTGDGGASLKPAATDAAPAGPPPLDFEAAMSRIPNTIDRGKAKTYLLGMFLTAADEKGHPEWLDALWQSKRKDGTPSFAPDEIAKIRGESSRIKDKMRVEADRAERKKHDDNADVILKATVDGNAPSRETIREWVDRGDLAPQFGFSYIENLEAEDRRQANELRSDQREADAQANNDLDYGLAADSEEYRLGVFGSSTRETDMQRFQNGELGTGKKAAARLRALNAARDAGEKYLTENPQASAYVARIVQFYKPKSVGGGASSMVEKIYGTDAKGRPYDYSVPIIAEFKSRLKAGDPPDVAYVAAVAKYGNKDTPDVKNARVKRAQYLEQKAAGR